MLRIYRIYAYFLVDSKAVEHDEEDLFGTFANKKVRVLFVFRKISMRHKNLPKLIFK